MLEVIAGVLVSLAALALVLEPLVFPKSADGTREEDWEVVKLEESASPKVQALLALKEIEFDHATGKLSDDDYEKLRARYAKRALTAIKRERTAPDGDDASAEAERFIRVAKGEGDSTCVACGPRPESDAVFCSSCGRALNAPDARPPCPAGGPALPEGAKFCAGCGGSVAELELEALHLS